MEEFLSGIGVIVGLIVLVVGIAMTKSIYKNNGKKPQTIFFGTILSIAAAVIAAIGIQIILVIALIIIVVWALR